MQTTLSYRWLYWLLLLVPLVACHRDIMPSQKANALFFPQATSADSVLYDLRQLFDPYNGGQLSVPDPARTLVLRRNGTYTEREGAGPAGAGVWRISPDGKSLGLTQDKKPAQQPTFDYTLLFRSADSLVLGRQGRHGVVEFRYKRVAK